MPRRHRFTAPFVLTAALASGCTKDAPKQEPRPTRVDAGELRTQNPPPSVTWAADPEHPSVLVPTPRTIDFGSSYTQLDPDLGCREFFRDDCAPGDSCNPPPPSKRPCPPGLMPRLVDGVQPTRRDDGGCWLDTIQVACPAVSWAPDAKHPEMLVPTPRSIRNGSIEIVLEPNLECMAHEHVQCDPGVKCNPPPPQPVPCPPELTPRPVPSK